MVKGRISVITLSYNNLKYYKECLGSIFSQTYKDIEWILCDDCSSDYYQYEAEINSYIDSQNKKMSNIVLKRNEKNLGVIKNYKQAIDMSTGEFIFYIAIDDMFYDEYVLENVVEYFESSDLKIFTGYRECFSENGKTKLLPFPYEVDVLTNNSVRGIFEKSIRVPMVVGACTPFRKALVDEYGFVNEIYTHLEDWPRYLELLEKGIKIGFLNKCLIKYRDGGITDEITNPKLIKDFNLLFDKYMYEPYSRIMTSMKEKKYVVAWGCSGGFLKYYKIWENFSLRKIDFCVDKNVSKWNQSVEGKMIYSPETLIKYNKEDLYILVFSQVNYICIAKELEKMGFVEGEHFDIVSEARVVGR